MKRMIKNSSLLTKLVVFVALLAALTFVVSAEDVQGNDLDLSLIFAPETQLVVNVDGSWSDALSDSYGFGDTATITAPANSGSKSFSHWEADGSVISYSRTIKLTMNADTTLSAVYADAAPAAQSTAGFTSITRTNEGDKISFQAIADAKDGESLTGAGIVYSTSASEDALTIGGAGVTNVPAVQLTDSTSTLPDSVLDKNNCWILQIPADGSTVYSARAYVTTDAGTAYGDVKEVKLSELESGVSLISNLPGFDPDSGLDDILSGLADGMLTVTFDANGGTGAAMTQAFVSGEATTLRANTYTNGDYEFNGWNTAADGSGTAYANEATVTLSADTTLYAMWKYDAVITVDPTAKELTYTGSEQALINAGAAEGGTMYYAVTTTDTTPADDAFTASIPAAAETGSYYIWYKVVGDSNHRDTAPASLTVKIVADMTALQAKIDEATEYSNSITAEYPAIAEALNTAISAAQAVTNESQSDVNAAVDALDSAINTAAEAVLAAKQLAASKEQLAAAIDTAKAFYDTIKDNEMLAEAANALKTAYESGEAALASDDTVALLDYTRNIAFALTAAEAAKEAADKAAADQVAADAVEEKISAIGEVVYTDECKAKIDDARTAYDALTDDQKAIVENYSALTAAEEKYAELKAAAETPDEPTTEPTDEPTNNNKQKNNFIKALFRFLIDLFNMLTRWIQK
ncbi:MAG: InlB B-repeat-containing protein [Clostridia bacterium]|nr:InlB B-repeat-containing protein [Clostridia bacterium]